MEKEQREIQGFIKRLRPSVRYFYRAAYAITADRQMAEYALNEALLRVYMRGVASAGPLGFRDSVLTVIRECAMARLEKEPSEDEWDGLPSDPAKGDQLAAMIARQSLETQRMFVLRYGCACTLREIAGLLDTGVDSVQDELSRCRLRIERALAGEKRPPRYFDRLAMRSVRQAMNGEQGDQIDVGYILRALETELTGRRQPRRTLRRAGKALLLGMGGLLIAALLWVMAVLMEM